MEIKRAAFQPLSFFAEVAFSVEALVHFLSEQSTNRAGPGALGERIEQLVARSEGLQKTLNENVILRQLLHPLNVIDSMEFLLSRMKGTADNQEFLDSMSA